MPTPRPMFTELISDLEKLGDKKIIIEADGAYPNGTPVAEVSHYQDHGTARITASNYTERAERENNFWKDLVFGAMTADLQGARNALQVAGNKIARDIMDKIDRIRTGKLKASMKARVE